MHLKESFGKINQFDMKINLNKFIFGATLAKFLGYMITTRGIESNHQN